MVKGGSDVIVLDLAVTWDTSASVLQAKCLDKVCKYEVLLQSFPGKTVRVLGLAF